MQQLLVKYEELEKEISQEYSRLIDHLDKDIEVEDYEDNFSIGIGDEINGGTYEVQVKEFNTDGTFLAKDVNDSGSSLYQLHNIWSLKDVLFVVELLEEVVLDKLGKVIRK